MYSQQTSIFKLTRNIVAALGFALLVCGLSQNVAAQSARCGLIGPGGSGMSTGDYGSNYGRNIQAPSIRAFAGSRPIQLVRKPIARYTELARQRCIVGKVRLRIRFLANGTLGKISVIRGLPYGLSEQAIEAANQIRFEPAMKNWKPVNATRELEYNFTIY